MTIPEIEYEHKDFLIINKPAGLPVYSTKNNLGEESVLAWFLEHYPEAKTVGDLKRPGIIHRLDKQTSGLLLLAKTSGAYEYLGKLFRSREITKEYLALVYGQLEPRHGIIDKPLSKIGFRGSSRVRVAEEGKAAVTEYWLMESYFRPLPQSLPRPGEGGRRPGEVEPLDQFTLLRIRLHTGRTHQIRVHLASLKHPVLGDNLYGKPNSLKLKDILERQFLHASRLEFKLLDGTWLEVESELPEDLQEVLSKLAISNF